MDGWNISFLLGRPIFSGYVVSFRECNITREPTGHTWTPNENRSTYAQSSHIYRVPTIPTEAPHHEQALEMHLSVSNGAKWYGPNIGDLTVVATSNKIGWPILPAQFKQICFKISAEPQTGVIDYLSLRLMKEAPQTIGPSSLQTLLNFQKRSHIKCSISIYTICRLCVAFSVTAKINKSSKSKFHTSSFAK